MKFPKPNLNKLHRFIKDLMVGQRKYHASPSQSLDALCHVGIKTLRMLGHNIELIECYEK